MGQVWAFDERVNKDVARDTGLERLGISAICIPPGESAFSHSHAGIEELSIVKSGTGTFEIEDRIYDICAGSVALVKPGEFHEIRNTGDENLEFTVVFTSDVDPKTVRLVSREEHFAAKDRPEYIARLSSFAIGEARVGEAFRCWAQKTAHAEFAATLTTIAIREAEHAHAFEKRLCELGYPVEGDLDPALDTMMQMYESDASDIEKLEHFGADQEVFDDPFDDLFKDKTIDPQTGALLGRFIAEERDSVRMLQACYKALSGAAAKSTSAAKADTGMADVSLADICAAVTSLTGMVAALQTDVSAMKAPAAMPAASKAAPKKANGRARAK